MKYISKEDFLENEDFYINEMRIGKVFIYPTDTLYGLGCNANLDKSVERIIEIKKRSKNYLLVVVPNINWIEENTFVNQDEINYILNKYKEQYSFILELKKIDLFSKYICNNSNKIGIRYPDNWFKNMIEKANILFVSTSVNLSNEPSAIYIKDISSEITDNVDYIVKDDSCLTKKPSTIVDLTNNYKQLR